MTQHISYNAPDRPLALFEPLSSVIEKNPLLRLLNE